MNWEFERITAIEENKPIDEKNMIFKSPASRRFFHFLSSKKCDDVHYFFEALEEVKKEINNPNSWLKYILYEDLELLNSLVNKIYSGYRRGYEYSG